MNLRSGWDSARHVRPGILLWRRLYPRKKVQGQRPHPGRMEDGAEPLKLKDIRLSEDERILTKITELDRVLGGGIVPALLFLWVEIRESENPPFFYRCAGILPRTGRTFCIFPERNLPARSG